MYLLFLTVFLVCKVSSKLSISDLSQFFFISHLFYLAILFRFCSIFVSREKLEFRYHLAFPSIHFFIDLLIIFELRIPATTFCFMHVRFWFPRVNSRIILLLFSTQVINPCSINQSPFLARNFLTRQLGIVWYREQGWKIMRYVVSIGRTLSFNSCPVRFYLSQLTEFPTGICLHPRSWIPISLLSHVFMSFFVHRVIFHTNLRMDAFNRMNFSVPVFCFSSIAIDLQR